MSAVSSVALVISVVGAVAAWLAVVRNAVNLRKVTRAAAKVAADRKEFEAVVQAWQGQVNAPSCGLCGQFFVQTGPHDYAHPWCPAQQRV
jgi:hypothetical protein